MAPRSMTGFARADGSEGAHYLTVELRSLNHRQLQLKSRFPEALQGFEPMAEREIRRRLGRGTVTLGVALRASKGAGLVHFDSELAGQYLASLRDLCARIGLDREPTLQQILPLPGVQKAPEESLDREALRELFERVLAEALRLLDVEREREGAELGADLLARLDLIEHGLVEFEKGYPEQQRQYEARLLERVRRFLAGEGHPVDDVDVVREVALFCEKIDVSEERTRLRAHLREFRRLLAEDASEGIGRRLDFLTQELLRETHTMGAKTVDGELSHVVLGMRAELERIKEQVQNIE
jgi:uncharacterized protein (TIGR00255 family)